MKIILFLAVAFITFGVFATQHTAWPEMLVYPYLLNNGFLPYKDMVIPYTPFFLWFLQGITSIFGYTPELSRYITLVILLTNLFLVWIIARLIWQKTNYAAFAVFFYSLWIFYFEGNGLWFDLFVAPFALLAFYFLYKHLFIRQNPLHLALTGALLGFCFLAKQAAVWMILVSAVFLSSRFLFFAPQALLFLLTVVVAAALGYLTDYLYWAYEYVFFFLPRQEDYQSAPTVGQLVKLAIPLVVLVPYLARGIDKKRLFTLTYLAATFMFAVPRWGMFHLVLFLPLFAASVSPAVLDFAKSRLSRVFLVLLIGVWLVVAGRQMGRFWNKPIRFFEADKLAVAARLEKDYKDAFLFNSHDQLYVLTQTLPPKPYVQNFASFFEVPGVQARVVSALEKEKPEYVVFSPGGYQPYLLGNYIDENYTLLEKLTDSIWVLKKR